jgi:rSAM/selenodomain-associated transferase 1
MTVRVLLFTRYPRPGSAKTRLGAAVGMGRAAALQTAFIRDELAMLENLEARVRVCCEPSTPLQTYRDLFGERFEYAAQRGDGLGERMLSALHDALGQGEDRAVLIGSDLPDLPAGQVQAAFTALRSAALCLGPAPDGGFHLLGLSAPMPPGVFADVAWGGPHVLARTLDNCRRLGLEPALLEPWPDVDTPADLAAYARRNRDAHTRTMACIREFNLAPEAWKS